MTLESLYRFFKVYFNYNTTGNVRFARAVADSMKVTGETMRLKNMSAIQNYLHGNYSNPIAKEMLHKLIYLSMKNYKDPFREIQYFETIINIDMSLLSTKRRGIKIPILGGYDYNNNKVIILTFGPANNMKKEIEVMKGLLKEFPSSGTYPQDIETIAYWDLTKGKAYEEEYASLQAVDRKSLLGAANRI